MTPRIYLAGPDVFHEAARDIFDRKKDICARFGLVGLSPVDNDPPGNDPTVDGPAVDDHAVDDHAVDDRGAGRVSARIYRGNLAMMADADAVIANLTPFRGVSADVGTAFELGYMAALGKPIFAYSNCLAPFPARIAAHCGAMRETPDGRIFAADGMGVENFGLADNLMLIEALAHSGTELFMADVDAKRRFADLTLFGECAKRAAHRLGAPTASTPLAI